MVTSGSLENRGVESEDLLEAAWQKGGGLVDGKGLVALIHGKGYGGWQGWRAGGWLVDSCWWLLLVIITPGCQ